jgi:hypothetical protein
LEPRVRVDGIEYRGIPSTSVICRLQVGTTVWHQLRGRGQISEVLSNSVKPYVVRYDSGQVTLADPRVLRMRGSFLTCSYGQGLSSTVGPCRSGCREFNSQQALLAAQPAGPRRLGGAYPHRLRSEVLAAGAQLLGRVCDEAASRLGFVRASLARSLSDVGLFDVTCLCSVRSVCVP